MSKSTSMVESGRLRYSEAFKRQVVSEIDAGRLSANSASVKYGIHGHATVSRWVRRYSKYQIPGTIVRMTSQEQQQSDREALARRAASEERIRQLEAALADAQLQLREDQVKIRSLETLIDLAESTYAIPLRKNSGAERSQP